MDILVSLLEWFPNFGAILCGAQEVNHGKGKIGG